MDDNTFECPNCGAKIYPEMTRCPQCGQNMYPEDETPPVEAEPSTSSRGSSLGAFFIGWMIAVGIALIINIIIAKFASPSMLGGIWIVILFLAGPLGALVGGYVCAGITRQNPKLLGVFVGVFTLPMLALFSTHWVEVNFSFLLSPWVLLIGLLTILAGFVGGWLNVTFTQATGWKEKWQVRSWEDLLYQDLLRKVRFNGSTADRLIEYEHKQDPSANRLKLIQNAIERWERDNR